MRLATFVVRNVIRGFVSSLDRNGRGRLGLTITTQDVRI